MSKRPATGRAIELLDAVGLPQPQSKMMEYPHRLSGGMRQRAMIAIALAGSPKLLIADEPTTALDITIQAQILSLLERLKRQFNLALLLITHDLDVVRSVADRVAVMYSGRIVETGPSSTILTRPSHPYTYGLLRARPFGNYATTGTRLTEIPGTVPSPHNRPSGCAFAPRCPSAMDDCQSFVPLSGSDGSDWSRVACRHPIAWNATT
jgi:oligopeptide/dipeptide ABC transporter ATP-binding protein